MITNKDSIQKSGPAGPDAWSRSGWATLRALLASRGGRLTPQRLAIYDAVVGQTSHPTVEAVHAAARRRFPGLSAATVYATLQLFADLGLVEEVGGRVRRYDGRPARHINLVCERCGDVADVEDPRVAALERSTAMRAGFDVRSARFELHGICPRCRAAHPATESRARGRVAHPATQGLRRGPGRPALRGRVALVPRDAGFRPRVRRGGGPTLRRVRGGGV